MDIAALMIRGMSREEVDKVVRGTRTQELQAFMDDRGHFENRVTIGNGVNRFGLPQTRVDFTRQPEFYQVIKKRLDLMEKVILPWTIMWIRTNQKIRTQSAHHMTSTCRMGKEPEHGVVDENLLVHGTDNLYVCSNAVFPTGSAVNPDADADCDVDAARRLSERGGRLES